jgi:hypothetical protein
MRWNVEDLETYEASKEYIDTAVIPVFSFNPNDLGASVVAEQTWLEEICVYAERQLTGRAILFPTLYVFNEQLNVDNVTFDSFKHHLWVTTNQVLAQQLETFGFKVYILQRSEDEEDLSVMVRAGKKLAQSIMEQWQTT